MHIEKAVNISGLITNLEIESLAILASTHQRILEIGSYTGKSTRALADNTEGFVVACDDFLGPREAVLTWKDRNNVYPCFENNVLDLLESGKVLLWRTKHEQMTVEGLAELVGEERLDMCFIDGGHSYADVARDIKFCQRVLVPGGMLCGHDFQFCAPDVIKAVTELLGQVEVVPNTSIWIKTLQ